VSVLRDPWTWIHAIVKFRLTRLDAVAGWRASLARKASPEFGAALPALPGVFHEPVATTSGHGAA
jgi:hypothetical protein